MRYAKRIEHFTLHQRFVTHSGGAFCNHRGDNEARVAVANFRARRSDWRFLKRMRDVIMALFGERPRVIEEGVEIGDVGNVMRESGTMGQEFDQRDRAVFGAHTLGQLRKHPRQRRIPGKYVTINQSGDQRGGHRLGVRADMPDIVQGCRLGPVVPPYTAHSGFGDLTVPHHQDAHSRYFGARHGRSQRRVQIRCPSAHDQRERAHGCAHQSQPDFVHLLDNPCGETNVLLSSNRLKLVGTFWGVPRPGNETPS